MPKTLKWNLRKKIFYLSLVAAFFAFLSANTAEAASLYFSPSSGNYRQGENFTISIKVKTDVAINALEGAFSFPTRYLNVVRINKSNSAISLWIQEPTFSNAGDFGNVSFEGVILNPGFIGPAGNIIDVVFLVKDKGEVSLEFLKTAIFANDGFGTNVTTLNGGAEFILLAEGIQSEEEKVPSEVNVQSPVIIVKEITQDLPKEMKNIIAFFNILPHWFKVAVYVLVGMVMLISAFILLSFGIIILIYIWRYAFGKRKVVLQRLSLLLKFSWYTLGRIIRKALIWLKITEKEFESDIKYGFEQLKTDFKKITSPSPPPFIKVAKDYWLSIGRIIKRFFTRNIPPSDSDKSDSGGDTSGA